MTNHQPHVDVKVVVVAVAFLPFLALLLLVLPRKPETLCGQAFSYGTRGMVSEWQLYK